MEGLIVAFSMYSQEWLCLQGRKRQLRPFFERAAWVLRCVALENQFTRHFRPSRIASASFTALKVPSYTLLVVYCLLDRRSVVASIFSLTPRQPCMLISCWACYYHETTTGYS